MQQNKEFEFGEYKFSSGDVLKTINDEEHIVKSYNNESKMFTDDKGVSRSIYEVTEVVTIDLPMLPPNKPKHENAPVNSFKERHAAKNGNKAPEEKKSKEDEWEDYDVLIHLGACAYNSDKLSDKSSKFFQLDWGKSISQKIANADDQWYDRLGNYIVNLFFSGARQRYLIHLYAYDDKELCYEAASLGFKKISKRFKNASVLIIKNNNCDNEFLQTLINENFTNGKTI
jgi:hypothetical protein